VSVRIFDAVLNKLVLNEMPFCILDGNCHNQLTIEHDGAVFGCDHFIEKRWQLAKIGEPGWENSLRVDGSEDVGLTIHGDGYVKTDDHVGRDIDTLEDVPTLESDSAIENDANWLERVDSSRLGSFAARKQHLPKKCVECEWKQFCYGGCPKHRQHGGEQPEPTALCEGYIKFYEHTMDRMQWLASFLRQNRQPPPPSPEAVKTTGKRGKVIKST
jgi:radical SAM protein with 4Fe4S-binding SPASM domain